jgi:hypothetical protein
MSEPTNTDTQSEAVAGLRFDVGDVVTWTHVKSSGSSFNFSTRSGKIDEIGAFAAFVKMRNGRKEWVHLSRLRKQGQRSELTEMFMGKPDLATRGSEP